MSGKRKKIKKRRASIVVKTLASNDRPLLALTSDNVEREDGLCLRRFKDNRDNRDNFFPCLQASTGRRNGLSLLSLLSFKKNKRAKNNPLVLLFIFCFLRFLYNRLFPIILVFSNCILYIGFSQLYWFFLIVFYILAFPNYIGFSQLYWFFPIVFYILAFPNYIVFFPNCLYSAPVNCPIKKMAPVARSFMM